MTTLLRLFVDNLLPAFLTAGCGSLLAWKTRIPLAPLSQVAFYLLSPCLIFKLVMSQPADPGALLRMAGFVLTALPAVGLLAWLAARALKLTRSMTAAMVLVVLLPNAGNLGLAVNNFAFGADGLAQAGLFFIVSALFSYSGGVLVASMGQAGVREALMGLVRVPALWAALMAFVFLGLGWHLPTPVDRAVNLLADASIPLFLVVLGMQLASVNWKGRRGPVLTAVALRLGASAVLAFAFAGLWHLEGPARQAAIFQSAMPSAVITSILATQFDGEADFVASVVFLSTILSPLTLTPLMAILGAR